MNIRNFKTSSFKEAFNALVGISTVRRLPILLISKQKEEYVLNLKSICNLRYNDEILSYLDKFFQPYITDDQSAIPIRYVNLLVDNLEYVGLMRGEDDERRSE